MLDGAMEKLELFRNFLDGTSQDQNRGSWCSKMHSCVPFSSLARVASDKNSLHLPTPKINCFSSKTTRIVSHGLLHQLIECSRGSLTVFELFVVLAKSGNFKIVRIGDSVRQMSAEL
jgi:hypothetical protein